MVLCKCFFKIILTSLYPVEGLAWWDWNFTRWTDQLLSFSAWHCWLGHLTRKNRPQYDLQCVYSTLPYQLAFAVMCRSQLTTDKPATVKIGFVNMWSKTDYTCTWKKEKNGKTKTKKLSNTESVTAVRSTSDGQSGDGWKRIYDGKDFWKRCATLAIHYSHSLPL